MSSHISPSCRVDAEEKEEEEEEEDEDELELVLELDELELRAIGFASCLPAILVGIAFLWLAHCIPESFCIAHHALVSSLA